ncbi:hypothetical protein RGU70_17435 [Herbaspirillum sp. RTI4]|uniref:hypothetical protein n=1 Tax=Herbaspirillum sp. RTI4 TaxID=3048640 RepID=UPI002AB500A2|nr:hypothetical protein [Herbaspirillum sp. RTI4]MDY7580095.1 hypothetical protein [Herbaspirillum sp. RTI4]MEA9983124.1 hypothetical protein [Herbaspirillum sp. RTI4]
MRAVLVALMLAMLASIANAVPLPILTTLIGQGIKLIEFSPEKVVVNATGTGSTRELAITAALLAASHQALGSLIVSTQESADDKLVRDEIIQHTTGIVNKYDVISCDRADGRYECTIKAVVSTSPLRTAAISLGAKVQTFDGGSAYAEQVSIRNSVIEGRKLVMSLVDQLSTSGMDLKLKSTAAVPTDSEMASVLIKYTVSINPEFADSMKSILSRLEDSTDKQRISTQPGYITVVGGWPVSTYRMYDGKMVAQIGESMKEQAILSVLITVRGDNDESLGTYCDRAKTPLFAKNMDYDIWRKTDNTAASVRYVNDPVIYTGRSGTRSVQIAMPEETLSRMRSVSINAGCKLPAK